MRDHWGFNPEVQFLANRGYAVLQMNYRGSTGYGRKFWEASFKKWGQEMQNDVTDGAKWLISEGIADPERVGIYGAFLRRLRHIGRIDLHAGSLRVRGRLRRRLEFAYLHESNPALLGAVPGNDV